MDPQQRQEHAHGLTEAFARDYGQAIATGQEGDVLRIIEHLLLLWVGVLHYFTQASHEGEQKRQRVVATALRQDSTPVQA